VIRYTGETHRSPDGTIWRKITPEAHLEMIRASGGTPGRSVRTQVRIRLVAAILFLVRGDNRPRFTAPKSAAKRRAERNRS
jgi:hypothetical protein